MFLLFYKDDAELLVLLATVHREELVRGSPLPRPQLLTQLHHLHRQVIMIKVEKEVDPSY